MKKILLIFLFTFFLSDVFGQNTFKAIVQDSESRTPLLGAICRLEGLEGLKTVSDTSGMVILKNISGGKQLISIGYIGYETLFLNLEFPLQNLEPMIILLKMREDELEEVIVSATRSSRTIEDLPTRVEVISGEELEEKGNMKPGDIRMMLNESTGIQTQQTSATSYNSSIRIQGLDGKYTQMIRDGFPLYSGFSGGLGLLQIVPLDLKQVEVIKGSASTLYGGGAIAGLVNLVSKTPSPEQEFKVLFNGTSALGLDASAFYSKQLRKVGTTIFASYHHGSPYDPANIGLTAIPQFNRFTVNPKLFFNLNEKTKAIIGLNATYEDRIGGDMAFIKRETNAANAYFEQNTTNRYSTQFSLEQEWNESTKLVFKNSLNYFDRAIEVPDFKFAGLQLATYSELNLNHKSKRHEWLGGINFISDRFNQQEYNNSIPVDYGENTFGIFTQHTWNANQMLTLESGLRSDFHSEYGFFFLPKISALFKFSDKFSSRIGGGLGYKTPNVFTEDAERIQFRNVLPIDVANREAERSYGGNWDVNYRTSLFGDRVSFSINQMFFYTRIDHPLVLSPVINGNFEFTQPDGFIHTQGLETNIKLTYGDFKLFVGYTYADVKSHFTETKTMPLVAKHRLNNVLMYEVEDKWKVGLEAYYYSPQNLSDGTKGSAYWIAGLMIEKLWERFSIFSNFENLTDTRQTRFGSIYTGTVSNPVFRDIYAPLDGFLFNAGLKFKF